eukprot:289650-Chlamydomonas_euryale.AAC.2
MLAPRTSVWNSDSWRLKSADDTCTTPSEQYAATKAPLGETARCRTCTCVAPPGGDGFRRVQCCYLTKSPDIFQAAHVLAASSAAAGSFNAPEQQQQHHTPLIASQQQQMALITSEK